MAVQLFLQNLTNSIVVEIDGDSHEEVEQTYYSFFNHAATDAELEWDDDKKAHFWSNWPKFKKGLLNQTLNVLLHHASDFKGKRGGAMCLARKLAIEKLNQIPRKEIVLYNKYQPKMFKFHGNI